MSTTTTPTLVPATAPDADRGTWMAARAHRVTASRIHDIAVGGRSTWLRILDEMLNGQKFDGATSSMQRGRDREAFLLDYLREFVDPSTKANATLYVQPENDRLGATPDGLGNGFGVEAKSLDFGADLTDIPHDHYDQMQFGMHVTALNRWLYIREVMGEDGEPTLDDPTIVEVARDDRRIAFLLREAERFLAWWDAGAPATDADIAPELDDALAAWADARARKKDAENDEAAAAKIIRAHIAATEGAEKDGLKVAGRAAQFVYSVSHSTVLDPEKWAAAEPRTHAAWQKLQHRADAGARDAAALYSTDTRSTRLSITTTKDAA